MFVCALSNVSIGGIKEEIKVSQFIENIFQLRSTNSLSL
jgi:hypothetical protein